jgi:hypothetical protein
VRNTNGENAPIAENTVEAPTSENKQENVSNEIEHTPKGKNLVELILEAIKWLLSLFTK